LAFHFSLSLHPNCRNWSPNYSVLVSYLGEHPAALQPEHKREAGEQRGSHGD
jgi:hypothetical protein